jgi:hypothetical protein
VRSRGTAERSVPARAAHRYEPDHRKRFVAEGGRDTESARRGPVDGPSHRTHRRDSCPRQPYRLNGGVLMGRPVLTLPYAVVSGGDPKFSPANEQWKQIERAYDHALPDNVRQAIVAPTINYLRFEPFERAAQPVSLERRSLETVQRAAETLYKELVTAPAITRTAYEVVQRLPSLVGEYASQLARLDDANLPCHREGACWEDWVLALMRIAEQSAGVRTDTDKNWRQSPFVVLVYELQQRLPPEARRLRPTTPRLRLATPWPRRSNARGREQRLFTPELGTRASKACPAAPTVDWRGIGAPAIGTFFVAALSESVPPGRERPWQK